MAFSQGDQMSLWKNRPKIENLGYFCLRTGHSKQLSKSRKFAQSAHPAFCDLFDGEKKSGVITVTKLDEFSPYGQLFTLTIFLKITQSAQMFRLLFN
jgi:hypothetical protein